MKSTRYILKSSIVVFILITMIINEPVVAQIITVRQDGSGDFTSVQQAVDSASNGDTVLVWPGLYVENILIDQKAIVLGSLTLTTNDPGYTNTTIIDGNQTGSCIYAYYCQDTVEINGFTIRNGSGTIIGMNEHYGGGIYLYHSLSKIFKCKIFDNRVTGDGGGIAALYSHMYLSDNLIRNNHAYERGGAIGVLGSVIFDSINLNSIYLNYASSGCEIYRGINSPHLHVVLDTFTVLNPDNYYLYSTAGGGVPNNDISYEILYGKIESVNNDLFVNPLGDDSNNGLSPDEPLKTIGFALSKILSDSLHPNTIHLANGVYSLENGEKFPLNMRSYVSLIGESRDSTILDASNTIYHLYGNFFTNDYVVKNITIKYGNGDVNSSTQMGSFIFIENHKLTLENLLFTENTGAVGGCGPINDSDHARLTQVEFSHNYGARAALRIGMGSEFDGVPDFKPDTVYIDRCIFRGNRPGIDTVISFGGGAAVLGSIVFDSSACIFTNCLFTGFVSEQTVDIGSNAFSSHMGAEAYLVNCTFSDNHWNNINGNGAPVAVTYGAWLHIYNSILFGDDPVEIYLYTIDGFENHLNIYHSLLEDGMFGIKVYSPYNLIYYDPSNLDVYPGWDTTEPYKYSLMEGSPCIDAGTLDLPPGLELPEYDIAGNPRIYGNGIDMGAYEYGPWVGVPEAHGSRFQVPSSKLLNVNPNPFSYGTYISYELKSAGRLNISIFNSSGMLVKTLVNYKGGTEETGEIYWDGAGPGGTALPAGIYFVRLTIDGKETETVKVVKVENSH
ncbi:MAG: DUF1565 domain-containing protein [Bacteroidales bacterium]|nr:DUF1565 domain-containing protein [Bacteroidales bacterium]